MRLGTGTVQARVPKFHRPDWYSSGVDEYKIGSSIRYIAPPTERTSACHTFPRSSVNDGPPTLILMGLGRNRESVASPQFATGKAAEATSDRGSNTVPLILFAKQLAEAEIFVKDPGE